MLAPVAVIEVLTSLLAVWLLTALHRRDPNPALRLWAVAFALQAATTLFVAHRLVGPEIVWATATASVVAALGAVFMVWGTLKYLGRAASRIWLWVPVALGVFAVVGVVLGLPFEYRALPVVAALGGSLVFVGAVVLRDWSQSVGARVAGLGLAGYGLHIFDYPVVAAHPDLLPWGHALAVFLQIMICTGFVLLYFERARALLAEQEAQYRALFENAVVGIFVADPEGVLVAANATLQKLVGSDGSLEGRKLRSFFQHGRDAAALLGAEASDIAAHAVPWTTDDGQPIDVRIYARRISGTGGAALLEGIVVDVTRMEHLERHLDQVQRAEVLGQLAGGIAHDINNVLTVVLANAELLRRDGDTGPRATELISGIREASEQGAGLTRQLLTFTRRHPSSTETFELGKRVAAAARMLLPTMAEIEIDLETELEGCGVHADPTLIEQLVVNLILNARDAVGEDGRVSVRVRKVAGNAAETPALSRSPGHAVLEVQDNGAGMDDATLRRAFEPFFSTKGHGTGLGLAVVKRVVAQSSATLEVDSAPGEGTTFRVSFPLVTVKGERGSVQSGPDSAQRSRTHVLVVEDRADVRRIIVRTLEDAEFDVTAPETSREAIEQIENGLEVSLLVTDVRMPEFSGPEVAAALRARHATVPVVFVSGFSDESELPETLDPKLTRFLSKPFAPDALVTHARELLAQGTSTAGVSAKRRA